MLRTLTVLLVAGLSLPAVAAPRPAREKTIDIKPIPEEQPTAPARQTLAQAEIVDRANAFLNGIRSMSANFEQVTADSRRATGRLFVQRPGRIRFDYDAPTPLEIVGDGSNVVVRDRKLNTSNVYPIGQTPLTFLLKDGIDIARDLKLTGASSSNQGAYVTFETDSTFVGASKVALFFDDEVRTLRQWLVVDTQGGKTLVKISNVDRSPISDPKTFDIRFQRPM